MPEYRESIVTFCDILGFSSLVSSQPPLVIESKLDAVTRHTKLPKDMAELFEAASFHFSDSIVRVLPLDSEANRRGIGIVFYELLDLVHAQMELIRHGVFLRGGVASGPVSFTSEQVFGPAMIRAYELESQIAVYPRIIVDPVLIAAITTNSALRKDTHDAHEEMRYVKGLLRRDLDGIWFVDYLYAGRSEANSPAHYVRMLEDHKEVIEQELAGCSTLNRTAAKHTWLAQYHNSVIAQLQAEAEPEAPDWQSMRVVLPAPFSVA
jgi:hypothetical protein